MNINEKLATIQTEFKSKKSRFNSFGKYYFRSAEDILEATKPFLKKLGVTVVITEKLLSNNPLHPILETTATLSDLEASVSATAIIGVDMNQKGMQTPQKFGAASSYGKKYALGNLFLIDDTQDSDATNTHGNNGAVKQKLTKRTLTLDMAEFDKAKEYLIAGGKLATIKKKYKIDKDTEDHLTMNTGARIETHEEA
tara:strand:- start:879 stop:1469 length:591 start_codon:yes stop_codon:yes gene_type:complete